MKHFKRIDYKIYFILLLIIAFGAIFRFYNLNWDNYQLFHPDERNIDAAVVRISFFSQMDPGFFAYGGLPIYLYRAAGDALNALQNTQIWTTDWGHINVVGRTFSAIFSTLTILFIFLSGKKLFDKKTGVLAAAIFAFTVSSIQIAHFATTESFLILIVSILIYASALLDEKPKLIRFLGIGFFWGLGTAAKTTSLSFILIPMASYLSIFSKTHGKRNVIISLKIILSLIFAFIIFTIFSPFTFLSSDKFLESMNYESGVATGRLVVPYTHQFDKAIPYAFEAVNLLWQMGPVFIFSAIGFFVILYFTFKKRHSHFLPLVIFPIVYFLYVGSWHTKFIRYMTPLLPFFALYAAFTFFVIYKKRRILGSILITIFVGASFFWALAYMSVYTKPQTRYTASLWMYKHIKTTDKVYTEAWDDSLPISIPGYSQGQINSEQLAIYDNEFNNKAEYYAQKLSEGNYIILVTRRLYGSLMYLPEEFPVTSKYYKDLFAGKLGYQKVAEFSSYPSLFGITINDDASEETFQVYDHPKVQIFKNVGHYSEQKLFKILNI